ncbi:MAG: hypothetical protein HQL54_01365 [Magnetococcales bacterium]|nr:hypothetical protein [Magnetococcales bacterium]
MSGQSSNWRRKWLGLVTFIGALTLLGGCTNAAPEPYPLVSQPLVRPVQRDMTSVVYAAADYMIHNIGNRVPQRYTILPSSFVDQNDLEQTSALGRRLAIQMASRFTQRGFSMIEVKLRKDLFIQQKTGEFLLSRELEKIRQNHDVKAVLAGSYAIAQNRVEVHAQLIRIQDQVVLTATDFTLPLDTNTRALLRNSL